MNYYYLNITSESHVKCIQTTFKAQQGKCIFPFDTEQVKH